MTADGAEGYPSREDRIVAEFGDGLDVEGIAFRHGLTVAEVYAVIEREVSPADRGFPDPPSHHPSPSHYAPPQPDNDDASPPGGPRGHYSPPPGQGYYGPPTHRVETSSPERYAPPATSATPSYTGQGQGFQPAQGSPDDDAIVAEYGEGNEVEWIARKHGIDTERVYEVVQRIVTDDPQPPAGPTPSW